ncbi:beta-ketoacyl-[acyl-carrier-protein] synthase II [Reticulibacter mediterranei]|uniref:Beta-ketoacyl-[acyl-carrier-protein] synthase II n=1 Tax=Reticulibacter mediterranei TaxID=2778369 RepID=A0A8J3ICP1_9CHLR|nr:beta-ketoacyl synthase N-terminal-like domain-containing protein [Reticulibacter mediterranei]GHO89975.1 beta-ketoacyl-[acyl-carrier-protein] synthase II [Reticulibacter mediterranei]
MSQRSVAITGIGTLTPAGRGTDALWKGISSGHSYLAPIDPETYFDPSGFACQVAGQVPVFSEPRVLTDSLLEQTDRCSQMALVAVLDALDMAKLPGDFRAESSPVSPERVSLTVASIAAGWTYAEREMQKMWTQGVETLNRYGMTASFPAGPQGHISIFFGVQGRMRTFVSERASGAHALIEGAKAIERGDAEIVIAGGTEAPLTPLVWAAYHSAHMLQPTTQRENAAQATHLSAHHHSRMLIGEGSTFLVLEERKHAKQRGVPILAEIRGWRRGTDPSPLGEASKQPEMGRIRAIRACLAQADIHPEAVDLLLPAGPALPEEDSAEEAAVKKIFDRPLPMLMPKTILGHLQGAATATDVAIAALVCDRQMLPSIDDVRSSSEKASIGKRATSPLHHALIFASGLGGMHGNLLISKPEQ